MKQLLITIAAVVLVGCGRDEEQLFYAALEGKTETVKLYLKNGAKADAEIQLGNKRRPWKRSVGSATALHVAKTSEIAKLLIKHGANSEAVIKVHDDTTSGFGKKGLYGFIAGDTPLLTAISDDRKDVVEILIKSGVNLNSQGNSDSTPLDRAIGVHGKDKEITDLLRKHGGKTGEELKAEGK
jgi:ankyrin repeat protein